MFGNYKNNSLFPPSYFTNAIFCFNLYKLTFFVFVQSIISHNLKDIIVRAVAMETFILDFQKQDTQHLCCQYDKREIAFKVQTYKKVMYFKYNFYLVA